jgi:F0F1-type ATP synthase membrane subunit b/b'
MIVEYNLIQNFIMAFFTVASLGLIIFAANKLFKKDAKPKTTPLPHEENINPEHTAPDVTRPTAPEKTNNFNLSEEDITRYKKIINAARQHAKSLLFETTLEAGKILSETKKTNEHMEEDLNKVLHKIAAEDIHTLKSTTQEFDHNYQQSLTNIQTQMQNALNEMIENTRKSYDQKLDEFMQNIIKNGLSSQSEVNKKTAELLIAAEAEIEEYKKTKFAQVDDQVNQLLQKVYRDVLRISMPENVHQDLIIKSLEQAKKEGMFKL